MLFFYILFGSFNSLYSYVRLSMVLWIIIYILESPIPAPPPPRPSVRPSQKAPHGDISGTKRGILDVKTNGIFF